MKKKSLVLIVLLLLVGLTSGYVSRTYAKYVKTLANATGTTTVAKWDFKAGTNYGVFEITLPETVNATTLVADRIAPGTSGTFTIDLDNTGSEVGVDFTITFSTATGVPSNLVFKQNGVTVDPTSQSITGYIAVGETLDVPLTWEWAYETGTVTNGIAAGDSADTTNGSPEAVADRTMTVSAKITGIQVDPATATTTGVTGVVANN